MADVVSARVARRQGISWGEFFFFLAVVVVVAWLFGTFDRYPFDDEVDTLYIIARYSPSELLGTPYEVHPPASYLIFQLLAHFGLPIWAMRLVSLIMSAVSFLLILDLTLATVPSEDKAFRLITAFLFLGFPLLYGVGDSLRWYPPFAVFVACFFWLELRRGQPTMMGGIFLGLAASTNFLAIIPYCAFAAQRYLCRRSFDIRIDGPFHIVLAIFAAPGLMAFPQVVGRASEFLQIGTPLGGVIGIAHAALGFFGGYRVGPVDILLGIPYLALLAFSFGSWRLHRPATTNASYVDDQAHDLFIIFAVMAALCALYSLATGFSAGRAWLFLAPFMLACFALGYWNGLSRMSFLPIFLASFLLFSTAPANGRGSDAPFKRNLVIPYDEVINFIAENAHGSVLYVSDDPVGPFLLRGTDYCVMIWTVVPSCADQALDHFDTIVLAIDSNFQRLPNVDRVLREIHQHRILRTKARFGYDRWATLKNLLTGARLDPWILAVEVYR